MPDFVVYCHIFGATFLGCVSAEECYLDQAILIPETSECMWLIPTWEAFERASV